MTGPSAFAGRLSLVSISDLLETMQANKNTGELRLKTDFGSATVWFDGGQLLDAKIGSFQGEAAVFRLLGLTDGSFEIKAMPVNRPRVITQPVRTLLRRRGQRSVEWKSLVERLPPLGTVLVLDLDNFSTASPGLTDEQLSLIQLVDGRRAIFEIIDDSRRDAVEVLREIDQLMVRGLLSADKDAPGGVGYGEAREGESGIIPPSSRAPDSSGPGSLARLDPPSVQSPPSSVGLALAPPSQVRGGPMLGRYEVLSRLGRGGMGTVYLARVTGDGGFRRLFAVKVLRSHLSQNDEATQMLLKEARIASRMDHPNIVSVVDVGTHEGQPYLVMDYVTGCSLADLLKSDSPKASTAAAVSVILDTLAGLHAAHTLADDDGVSLDVIHHDVSPHNIMVGLDGIARLSDFGVAYVRRSMRDEPETSRGKPAFTAPERVSGGPGDRRSDLFSVGVILWNALTGASLFEGPDIESTLENVLTRPIPPASRYGRSPESLDAICFKALQRSPAKRYQSAEEMLVQLRKVAAAEDLLGSPSQVTQWVKDAMGRELDVQRLSFLDAARMAREAELAESVSLPQRERPQSLTSNDASRTIALAPRVDQRNTIAKWLAVGLALGLILLAMLLPDRFGTRIKRMAANGSKPAASGESAAKPPSPPGERSPERTNTVASTSDPRSPRAVTGADAGAPQ